MGSLPQVARFYIFLLIALAVGAVLFSASQIGNDLASWALVAFVTVCIALLEFPIVLFGERVELSLAGSIKFATILLFPPSIGILATFIADMLSELRSKRAWYKKLFNSAELTIAFAASALVFRAIYYPQKGYFSSLQNVLAILLAGITLFLFSWSLVSIVISLTSKTPIIYVLVQNARQVGWHELSHPALGTILAILWQYDPISTLLIGVPILLVRRSSQLAVKLQHQMHDALQSLMRVIDERDHHTFDHSERVAQYAQRIAQELELSQEQVEIIESAALLHDLGKVGMVDDVLFGTKSLDPAQRKHAQQHAEVGSQLMSKLPFFDKGTPLIRHHHERYDGKGYPDGLAGEQIPIGSRIISVADAYQAMTEIRAYRPAVTQEEAIAELTRGSGTQFDPKVVDAFIRLLRLDGQAH